MSAGLFEVARLSRNPISEYLSQSRKGRKEKIQIIQTWRSWRLGERNIRISHVSENLRALPKLSTTAVRRFIKRKLA
jgi:hypothetical protein